MSFSLSEIDYKKPTTLETLSLLWFEILEELKKEKNSIENIEFLEQFTSVKILKNDILIDKTNYFLIKEKEKPIGFISTKENDKTLFNNFYLFKSYKNKTALAKILNLIYQHFNSDFKITINQFFQKELLEELELKQIDSQITYLGSDCFLKEIIFENKKNPL